MSEKEKRSQDNTHAENHADNHVDKREKESKAGQTDEAVVDQPEQLDAEQEEIQEAEADLNEAHLEDLELYDDDFDNDDYDEQEAPKRFRPLRVVLFTVLFILLLLGGTAGGLAYYIYQNLQPVDAANEDILVTIPKGASSARIGEILHENGLIRDAELFRYYIRFKEMGTKLQAGDYIFAKGMTIDQLIKKMASGDVFIETFTFTIPEGLSVPQIAEHLASKGIVDKEVFLKEVNEGTFDYDFVKAIPEKKDRKYRLEGYLFPETYEMKKGATEHEIIDRLLKQFDHVVTDEWEAQLETLGLTLDEAVTLASIVEREAVLAEERPIIAGVFYNRIEKDWLLQSCATVQYILGKQRDVITYADLEVDDPYNTYIYEGLPPGAISNPGASALRAVVFPEEHSYFFFVTKKDGSGSHHFSKTYAEHLKNDAKSRGSW